MKTLLLWKKCCGAAGQDPAQVVGDFRTIDERRRQLITQAETMKAKRNRASEESCQQLRKVRQDTGATLLEQNKALREKG